jgi:putative intracellular protease/amidase
MKKALIVITSHVGDWKIDRKTGYWLGEVTHFYHLLHDAGYEVDLVSPKGGTPPLDIKSIQSTDKFDKINAKLNKDEVFQKKLNNTLKPEQINPKDYAVIYFAGGHGVMWDFPDNKTLADIAKSIYESGGVVSAVCHGSVGLLNIKLTNGKRLIEGKKVTGFANTEEALVRLTKQVPYLTEDELKAKGGIYKKALLPFVPYSVVHDRLVTGQNPYSSKSVAKKVLKILGGKK